MNPSHYNSSNHPENDLHLREAALRQRELELRIRELESEIQSKGQANGQSQGHQFQTDPWQAPDSGFNPSASKANEPPVTPTSKYDGGKPHWHKWRGKLWLGLEFAMIMIVVIAAINVAKWLGGALIIGMLTWVAYKVLFETD